MLNAVAVKCIPSPPPPPSPLCKGIRIPALPIFPCAIRNQGKRLTYAYRIPLTIEIQKTSSINKHMHSTWNPESKAWNPESNSTLDSLTWGKGIVPVPHTKKKLQKRNRRKKLIWQTAHFRCTMVPTFKSFLDMNNYYYKLLISCRALK